MPLSSCGLPSALQGHPAGSRRAGTATGALAANLSVEQFSILHRQSVGAFEGDLYRRNGFY